MDHPANKALQAGPRDCWSAGRRHCAYVPMAMVLVLASSNALYAQEERSQGSETVVRFGFGANLGLGGGVHVELPPDPSIESPMQVGGGVFVYGDIALGKHVIFRPRVQWRSVRAADSVSRGNLFAVGLGLGIRHVFVLDAGDPNSLALEPLLVVNVGVGAIEEEFVGVVPLTGAFDEPATLFGLNFGVRTGLIAWFGPRVGVSVAFGFERSDYFPELATGDRGRVHIQQGVVDVGMVIATSR